MEKNKILIILTIFIYVLNINIVNATDVANPQEGYLNYIQQSNDYPEFPTLKSENILLYNLDDNTILYSQNTEDKISIASLTKIMTTLVVLENIDNLDDTVTVSKDALYDISEYTLAGFKVGDIITYRDLLYGTMLPSGADAAQELAIAVSGSIPEFVKLMNEKAKALGMLNTNFSNPVGRDDKENYSTVNDIAKLLLYALNNEEFYKIYTSKTYTTTNNIKLTSTLKQSGDRYNLDTTNILGSKSGYTDGAGLCLTSIAKYNDINYLLITANAPYINRYPSHIEDAINIYSYYSNNYTYKEIISKNQELTILDIVDGFEKKYTVTSHNDISLYLDNDINLDKLEYNYKGVDKLTSKIKTNDKIGNIEVIYDNNILYTYPIYLTETIKYKHTKLVISILTLIIILILVSRLLSKKKRKKRRKKYVKRNIKK